MNYKILASGSTGNAVVIEDIILIDCGVSFKALKDYYKDLQLVLFTHIHSDHFNKSTIRRLAYERPTLRFGCRDYLVHDLICCGVDKKNIDVYDTISNFCYKDFCIANFDLVHDVPNCGYKLSINDKKYFYATDTCSLDNIEAKDYDMYFIEGNYEDKDELEKRKQKHIENGEYSYEDRVEKTHLSQIKATEWLMENMGEKSQYIFMHQHKENRKEVEC